MSAPDEVTDSTDWLNTTLSSLSPLESGLRCQVCKDFFTTPMITSCSHTFCSLCIRRYLSQEGRCPACRESDQEMKLRRNWAIEELVEHFKQCRAPLLEFAQKSRDAAAEETSRPKKRRRIGAPTIVENSAGKRSTRSQSRRIAASASQASQEPMSTQEEVADTEDEGSVYHDEPTEAPHKGAVVNGNGEMHDGLVACPCCNRRMKETSINTHLDLCIQGLATSPSPPPPIVQAPTTLAYSQRTKPQPAPKQKDRLPTINYSMYSETSLRKKLKELGLPAHGSKELMRKRHTEWVNIWNADCDSSKPKTKRDLLRELDTWERTLGRQIERGATSGSTGVMVKDFDREGWVKSQKDEFDDLIKKAREKRKLMTNSIGAEDKDSVTTSIDDDVKMSEASEAQALSEQQISQRKQPPDASVQDTSVGKHTPRDTEFPTPSKTIRDLGSSGLKPNTEGHSSNVTTGNAPKTPDNTGDTPAISLEPNEGIRQNGLENSSSAVPTTCSNQSAELSATTPGRSRSRFFV